MRVALRAVLAGVSGSVVGIAAYAISQTGGQRLSVIVGCLIGVAVALGLELYRRSAQLTEVRLVLLGNEMSFTTKTDMRQAAQRMFFQAATRVATRPLEDGSGNLREALTSLKTLFDLYREPLEGHTTPPPPAKGDSVYELVLDILNFELAPFLAAWHPSLADFEARHPERDESEWPQNAAFRAELRQLQERLRPYVIGLGEIAGIRDPERHLRPSGRSARSRPAVPQQDGARPGTRE
ncbi:hypothetical protein ACF1HU_06380 [Streptomyces olivaceus]|uniref:hypothetical protein n=1 Tax=Streptomyces olivaceus TaxID=47716 RepID=UPI001CCB9CE3|nr:hypothetical protein [Streptomyces olivaceus]MBZ6283029.1 hypothetical protein [Streptomyces olivaceus]